MMENSYFVEKTIEKEVVIKTIVEETIKIIDWSKVPCGTYMIAKIRDKSYEGVVWNDPLNPNGRKYFCQNYKIGSTPPFGFGFNYGWEFRQEVDGTHTDEVSDIQFPPKPESLRIPPIPIYVSIGDGTYQAEVISNHTVKVGCQKITKEEILNVLKAMESLEE
jgi:hypothetical protein